MIVPVSQLCYEFSFIIIYVTMLLSQLYFSSNIFKALFLCQFCYNLSSINQLYRHVSFSSLFCKLYQYPNICTSSQKKVVEEGIRYIIGNRTNTADTVSVATRDLSYTHFGCITSHVTFLLNNSM